MEWEVESASVGYLGWGQVHCYHEGRGYTFTIFGLILDSLLFLDFVIFGVNVTCGVKYQCSYFFL